MHNKWALSKTGVSVLWNQTPHLALLCSLGTRFYCSLQQTTELQLLEYFHYFNSIRSYKRWYNSGACQEASVRSSAVIWICHWEVDNLSCLCLLKRWKPWYLWGIFQAFVLLPSETSHDMTTHPDTSSAPFPITYELQQGKTDNCWKYFRKMASCFVHVTSLCFVSLNAWNPI